MKKKVEPPRTQVFRACNGMSSGVARCLFVCLYVRCALLIESFSSKTVIAVRFPVCKLGENCIFRGIQDKNLDFLQNLDEKLPF